MKSGIATEARRHRGQNGQEMGGGVGVYPMLLVRKLSRNDMKEKEIESFFR